MRYRLECPANRYVFKSHLNCLESTAGSLRQSGSEFQTVGPATEKARVPKVPRRTRGTLVEYSFLYSFLNGNGKCVDSNLDPEHSYSACTDFDLDSDLVELTTLVCICHKVV